MIDPDIRRAIRILRNHLFVGTLVLHGQASFAFGADFNLAGGFLVLDLLFALVLAAGIFQLSSLLDDPGDTFATTAARATSAVYVLALLLLPFLDLDLEGRRVALSALSLALLVSGYLLGRRFVLLCEDWRMPAAMERMRRTVHLYAWLLLLPLAYYHGAWIAWSWAGAEVLPRTGFHLWAGLLAGFIPIAGLARTASALDREATIADWLEG